MGLFHRGVELSQEQANAIIPVINSGIRKRADFEAAIDRALEDAGCPVVALEEQGGAGEQAPGSR